MHVPCAYHLVMPLLQLCNQTAHQLVNSSLPLTTANTDTCSLNAETSDAQDMHRALQPSCLQPFPPLVNLNTLEAAEY